MRTDITDFVGVFEEALSPEFCKTAIEYYGNMKTCGHAKTRQEYTNSPKHLKDDESVLMSDQASVRLDATPLLSNTVYEALYKRCLPNYIDAYPVLSNANLSVQEMKLQKTRIGGGYHMWHYETSGISVATRKLVYMVYLNDVVEGGETEFLYYHRRLKPKAGTMVIFPAEFTHTHRGNPPISNEKYIINGWLELS
jgi:hypothetical protein